MIVILNCVTVIISRFRLRDNRVVRGFCGDLRIITSTLDDSSLLMIPLAGMKSRSRQLYLYRTQRQRCFSDLKKIAKFVGTF